MTVTAAALRDLHRIHRQLTDLRERLDRGPRQIKARQAGLDKLKEELAAARDAHLQAQKINDGKQLDLKTGEQRIVDLGVKLNTASSNKEYQMLLEQIEASKMAGSVLSDEILEGFDIVDELAKGVQQSQEHVAAGESELKKTTATVEDSAESIRTDIVRLEEELIGAEATLPSDLKPDYVRVVQKKGAEALAELDDEVCTGCGKRVTLNMLNELQLSKLVFCKSCGCLLYLPEA